MIKIELTFTSVAEAAAFLAGGGAPNASVAVAQTSSKPSTAATSTRSSKTQSESPEKTASAATQSGNGAQDPASSTEQGGERAADEAPKVEYADLQKAVMALVAISTEEMKKIVDSFGIKTFKGSDESIWPQAMAKINARIGELKEGMA